MTDAVIFSHPYIQNNAPLKLRLAPTKVEWTYDLKTSVQATYTGEVVQILGINFDKFILEGRFGKEGPHGAYTYRDGAKTYIKRRPPGSSTDWQRGNLGVGLSQMMEYFRQYFAIASQGNDSTIKGSYNQMPMKVVYQGGTGEEIGLNNPEGVWYIYPTSFPSYRRSNENFAPEWHVEGEVVQAPGHLENIILQQNFNELTKTGLRSSVVPAGAMIPGAFNPFNDPAGLQIKPGETLTQAVKDAAATAAQTAAQDLITQVIGLDPATNPDDLIQLLQVGASLPYRYAKILGTSVDTSANTSSSNITSSNGIVSGHPAAGL